MYEIIAFLGSPKSQKVYRYISKGNVDGWNEGNSLKSRSDNLHSDPLFLR